MADLRSSFPFEEEKVPSYLAALVGYLKSYHHKDLVEILLQEEEKIHYSIEVTYVSIAIIS